jgi:hypothetical protein
MHAPGALAFLALCALWPWLLYHQPDGKNLLDGFLMDSLYARVFPPAAGHVKTGHNEPFWYYFASFPASIMPWLICAPAMAHWFWRKRLPQGWNRGALVFLAWIFPIGLLMLSAAGTKRELYLLPLVAPFGAVAGAWLASIVKNEQPHGIDRATVVVLLVLFTMAAMLAVLGAIGIEIAPVYLTPAGAKMALRIPRLVLMLMSFVGGIFLLFAWYSNALLQRGRPRVAALAVWMAFGLTLTGMPLFYRGLDSFKNLHRFTSDLERMNAFSPDLAGYRADETTVGIVAYDLHRNLAALNDAKELDGYMQHNPEGKVLMLKQDFQELPRETRDRLHLIRSWPFDAHREYLLFDFNMRTVLAILAP